MQDYPAVTPRPDHVQYTIESRPGKGRGLFASEPIDAGQIIEIAPVVVLPKEQAELACRTLLNDYVFTWRQPPGSMAVSLGHGSLFNHSAHPNVSYTLDYANVAIVYRASRTILTGEELCIYYGTHARYDDVAALPETDKNNTTNASKEAQESDLDRLFGADLAVANHASAWTPVVTVLEQARTELSLVECWAVDVEPRQLKGLFEQLRRRHGQQDPLHHLRKVRPSDRSADLTTLLLFPCKDEEDPSEWLRLSGFDPDRALRTIKAPASAPSEADSYDEWCKIWPIAKRPDLRAAQAAQQPSISPACQRWVERQLDRVLDQAKSAQQAQFEVPAAALVCDTWDDAKHDDAHPPAIYALTNDTRKSTGNALSHAAINAIDVIAQADLAAVRDNGNAYLLTGLTVIMTHEPCLFCSMSLLHSRIAKLFYVWPTPSSGGCGSVHAVHEEDNLNHRFQVWRRTSPADCSIEPLELDV